MKQEADMPLHFQPLSPMPHRAAPVPAVLRRALLRLPLAVAALACGLAGADASAAERTAIKRKLDLPPSADLHYASKARQKGMTLSGESFIQWRNLGKRYSVYNESRVPIFGKIHESRSSGEVDSYGLAPDKWEEKRYRRDPSATTFDRSARRVSFSDSDNSVNLVGGEQDRASVEFQLAAIARATPDKVVDGAEWRFFVAGRKNADPWVFKVVGREKLETPLGAIDTVHLSRQPSEAEPERRLDLWLAPGREWYPVKLVFKDADGEFIEQVISRIEKK
jgi:hypothetical protein